MLDVRGFMLTGRSFAIGNPQSKFPCPAASPTGACCSLQIHDVHLDAQGVSVSSLAQVQGSEEDGLTE